MKFIDFEIVPTGRAKLSVEEGVLGVSNTSDTGLDGVLILVDEDKEFTVHFDTLESISDKKGVLNTSTIKKKARGTVLPFLRHSSGIARRQTKLF